MLILSLWSDWSRSASSHGACYMHNLHHLVVGKGGEYTVVTFKPREQLMSEGKNRCK